MIACVFAFAIVSVIQSPASGRISAFHVDVETCSGLLIDGHTKQEQLKACASFFPMVSGGQVTLIGSVRKS